MQLKKIIENLNYQCLSAIDDCEIKGISSDSRDIQAGFLFTAIEGEKYDGHSFVNEAIDRGASAVILQRDLPLRKKVAKILVADSRQAYAFVCASFFNYPARNLKVIGVTGTNGKTTTAYLLEKMITSAAETAAMIGTVNYRLGNRSCPAAHTTPPADTLQSFLQEIALSRCKYAIIEVSSHALSQHRVDGVDFSGAIFTNLSPEHLDYHGSIDNYFSCKASLFERLPGVGWAVINVDDYWGKKLAQQARCRLLTYGIESAAQIQAKHIKLDIARTVFSVFTPKGKIEIETSLIGRHNVYNILAALAAAVMEDIDFSSIVLGIKECTFVCGRLERVDCGQDFSVFIDYAHTEDALKNILRALRGVGKNKIILVFGCGGDRDRSKRPKMGALATELSDFVIITNDNPRNEDPLKIVADIKAGIAPQVNNYKIVLDRAEAIKAALSFAGKADTVVIAGKGHESEQIFAHRRIFFSDRKQVEDILQCSPSGKY